jgi:BTB/POZ domain
MVSKKIIFKNVCSTDSTMTEVAPLPSSPHLQASATSCASDLQTPTLVSPRTVRFYCADVPDLSEFFYSKSMSDVNIAVGDRQISAHRSRLASVSPFLASIFASDTSEVSTVVLPDVSFAAVNVLINFLYSGFMRVTKKEIAGILEVATLLGISYPIDIEETELGVVRIKPLSAKKRSVGQEDGIGLMAKKARMGGPKVVIFEGLAKNVTLISKTEQIVKTCFVFRIVLISYWRILRPLLHLLGEKVVHIFFS